MKNYFFNKNIQEYTTPPHIIKDLEKEFGKMFDPCPINPQFDGLKIAWKNPSFVNPPYKYPVIIDWIKKCISESNKGNKIILLIFVKTDTKYFHDLIYPLVKSGKAELRFIKGRLSFGNSVKPAPFPSMLVIFK